VYPPGYQQYFRFTDGKGLQAFVLVASHGPLPPFAEWAPGRSLGWSSLPPSAAWSFDGLRWEQCSNPGDRTRGQVVQIAGEPAALTEACRRLAEASGVDAVRAVAFPLD
jgi:hypothetical protein